MKDAIKSNNEQTPIFKNSQICSIPLIFSEEHHKTLPAKQCHEHEITVCYEGMLNMC